MKPYHQIFPDAQAPSITLELAQKSGRIPRGRYAFVECYCTRPGCDCRRVTLLVLNEKMRHQALICLGFDGEGPFCGPYLDGSSYQVPYASELLDFCVHTLNSRPDWVLRMYQQYRDVRELVDGRPYRGRDFPQPGDLFYRALPSPDLEAMLKESVRHGSGLPCPHTPCDEGDDRYGMVRLVELYARAGASAPASLLVALQDELHRHLLADPLAVEELVSLLPALSSNARVDDDRVAAALRILCLTLDFYQVEVEGGGPGARQQMQRLQSALALRIFREKCAAELRFAVADILAQCRVKLIPELQLICDGGAGEGVNRFDLFNSAEEFIPGVLRHFASVGLSSPFAGAREILELVSVSDPEMRPGLTWELMNADSTLLREIAALLLFNADPEQSRETARMLVSVDGASLTPNTLRRLIVARNWFPEPTRSIVDQTINNARKARVQCAHLDRPDEETVYASCLDGSGTQYFHILVPDGAAHAGCTLMLQQGYGVSDCSLVRLETRRDRDDFIAAARSQRCCLESTGDYLDLRVCQALAEGTERGRVPGHWLVRVAELLGRDHWKGRPLDAGQELSRLREGIAENSPALLLVDEHLRSLEESGEWHRYRALFGSWKEEGRVVESVIDELRASKGGLGGAAVVERLCDQVLEQKRPLLLDRLILATLWLKSAKEAPIPWQRMYHVAQAVADPSIALKEIPLAVSMARESFKSYHKRSKDGRQHGGDSA